MVSFEEKLLILMKCNLLFFFLLWLLLYGPCLRNLCLSRGFEYVLLDFLLESFVLAFMFRFITLSEPAFARGIR